MIKTITTVLAVEIGVVIASTCARGYFGVGGETVIPLIVLAWMVMKGEENDG